MVALGDDDGFGVCYGGAVSQLQEEPVLLLQQETSFEVLLNGQLLLPVKQRRYQYK